MLLLATEAGELVKLNTETKEHQLLFKSNVKDAFMGIAIHGEHLFLATLERVYKLSLASWQPVGMTETYRPSPDFHQMQIYDERLYTTITKRNQIWVYDLDLNLVEIHHITPPFPGKKVVYKKNYNHINNIVKRDGKFYINLNWFTSTPYASSGVAVLNEQFKLLEKFEFSWESHDFQFVDDDMVALCACSSKRKKIMHPNKAGLWVNNELVFEHNPDTVFCKGLTYNDRYYYLCGGKKKTRVLRRTANGVIYIVDRQTYKLVETIDTNHIKAIKGCLWID